ESGADCRETFAQSRRGRDDWIRGGAADGDGEQRARSPGRRKGRSKRLILQRSGAGERRATASSCHLKRLPISLLCRSYAFNEQTRADFGLCAFPRAGVHGGIVAKLLHCIFSIMECAKILRSPRCARTTLADGDKCGAGAFLSGADSGGG